MTTHSENIHALFQQFLEVCNQAIQAHKNEFPYNHIWEAAEQAHQGEMMHVTLYDDEPKADYSLCLKDKHIDAEGAAEEAQSTGWRINKSYMKQVVADPEAYISDPTKLNWDWLKSR